MGINSKIPEIVTDEQIRNERTPKFCYCDTFVSFFELMWNFNCTIEDVCDVVEKVPIQTYTCPISVSYTHLTLPTT